MKEICCNKIINYRYKVERTLGHGGSSCVYLVKDIRLHKYWAMKVMSRRSDLSHILARQEIDMLRSINYPMFPKIADAWQDGDSIYIISEYIEGVSLDKVVGRRGVSINKAQGWALGIAKSLEYLHGLSPPILYLDLKPENLILKADGSLSLVDFGIAGRITGNTMPIGTVGYAAPEQYEGRRDEVTEKTDIYAFGMTYYTIRCGRSPDRDYNVTAKAIADSRRLSIREKAFLKKCTDPDPSRRFSHIEQAAYQLQNLHREHFNIQRILISLISLGLIAVIAAVLIEQRTEAVKQQRAAEELAAEAAEYISNGEYTEEGIKVITAFINSGSLGKETEQEFIYEAAMNYFQVQQDYRNAYRYFKKLDENRFPEASYLVELCGMQLGFEVDAAKAEDSIGRFYGFVCDNGPYRHKYDNLLFISSCYEHYDEDETEGMKKAVYVLEKGLSELEDGYRSAADEENKKNISRFRERIEYLNKRIKLSRKASINT